MFGFRRQKPAAPPPQPTKGASGKSSHWIDGPSEMAKASMMYFGVQDRSQEVILEAIRELIPLTSVVDFGTGRGSWLKAAIGIGVTDVRGYDIPEIPIEQRQFPAACYFPADLGQPVAIERKFSLSISTEVAEHLPKERAATFIANVASASDLVLFSAAIPYQGGAGHCNENWVEYWAKMFADLGFECFDILRMRFWNVAAVRSYYRQNLLIFATGTAAAALRARGQQANPAAPSLVHPEQYLKSIGRALPPEMAQVGADVRHYYDCVTKSPQEVDADPERRTYGQEGVGWGVIRGYRDKP